MPVHRKNIWQTAPFVRLLIPLVLGILTAFYFTIPAKLIEAAALPALFLLLFFSVAVLSEKFKWRYLGGVGIHILLAVFGAVITNHQNLENNADWLGYQYQNNDTVLFEIEEPLVKKQRSWKALSKAVAVYKNGKWKDTKGYALLYFKSPELAATLNYGDRILLNQPLKRIAGAGNPGAFDYQRFCALQQIHFQAYIPGNNYTKTDSGNARSGMQLLYKTRNKILAILKENIPGEKEKAVAEALLIGYKDDLDKTLVQSYSNTGVVHIIAISGLHLAMIYGLMLQFLKPFGNGKWANYTRALLILAILWGFSFITGGAAAILRSAVTFSFLLISKCLGYKNSTINALAASAFCLLVYNPYLLWDIGFQLSYTAVLSIVLFSKHISNWFYIQNQLLKQIWQLNAVTLSAQVLTLPLILYHFHQFPNFFLFTNFVVVPLSGLILYAEILLLLVSPVPLLALWTGKTVGLLITQMNTLIERTNRIPFAITDNIHFSIVQTLLLYLAITALITWFIHKTKTALITSFCLLTGIFCLRSIRHFTIHQQQKLVVFQVPKQSAMDIYTGNKYQFWGDSGNQPFSANAERYLQLSRRVYQVDAVQQNGQYPVREQLIITKNYRIQLIDGSFTAASWRKKKRIDLLIITGNPRVNLQDLARVFDCNNYVADCSNALWKIQYWKKDAENLHLHLHSVPDQGAFIMDL